MNLATGAIGKTIVCKAKDRTYLPDILDLKGKTVKFIDCLNGSINYDKDGNSITAGEQSGIFLNLMKANTQELFIKNSPLSNFQFSIKKGKRDNIIRVIDFPNSFIENHTNTDITLFLVFWFDDQRVSNLYNEQDVTNVDSFDVFQFNSTENVINFDENRSMTDKQIRDFFVMMNENSFTTPNAKTSVTETEIKSSFLTLSKDNYQFVRNLPLVLLKNNDVYERIKLQNVVFDFTNSFIEIPTSLTASVAGKAYFFNIEYKQ